MAIPRGIDGAEPLRSQRIERLAGPQEERRTSRSRRMGGGTLTCPACDAPVAPAVAPMSPTDPLDCPFCDHEAAVRDFLSLAKPSRPARVGVYVLLT
jgi:hypothetical protein